MSPEPQHMVALAAANRVRLDRGELKREIAVGKESVASVLVGPPECARPMTVFDLLVAQHRWGRTRARRVLSRAGVSEFATVGALTARQVDALLRELAS